MKNSFLIGLVFSVFVTHSSYAQQAVIDAAAIAQAVQQLQQLQQQYTELQNQTVELQRGYNAITGSRGFGDMFKAESFRDNLPDNWQQTYSNLRGNGYNGLSQSAKAIYDKNKIYDQCQSVVNIERKKVCEAKAVKTAQDQAFLIEILQKQQTRTENIDNLLSQIRKTSDPKSIGELQARIAAEQSIIANDQAKLRTFKMASEAEDRSLEQQEKEIIAKAAATRGNLSLEPVTFN